MKKLITILLFIPMLASATNYTWPSGTNDIFIIGSGPSKSFASDLANGDTIFIPVRSGGYRSFSLYRVRGNNSYNSIVIYWNSGAYITRNTGGALNANAMDSCVGVSIYGMNMSGSVDMIMRLGKDDYGPYSTYQNGYSSYITWDHCTFNYSAGMGLNYWTGWPDYAGDTTKMMHHWKWSYCSFDTSFGAAGGGGPTVAIGIGYINTYGYWRDVEISNCTFDHYYSIVSGPSVYINCNNTWGIDIHHNTFQNMGGVVSPVGHGVLINYDIAGSVFVHHNIFGPNNFGNDVRGKNAGLLGYTKYDSVCRFYNNISYDKRKYPILENQRVVDGDSTTLAPYVHRRKGTAIWNNTIYNISRDSYIAVIYDCYLTDSLEVKNNVLVMIRDSTWASSNVRVFSPSNGAVAFVDTAKNKLVELWPNAGLSDSTTFTPTTTGILYNAGTTVPAYITTDFYGNPRSNGAPDIGAVEYTVAISTNYTDELIKKKGRRRTRIL